MLYELRRAQWTKEISDITNLVSTLIRGLTPELYQDPKM